MSVFRPNAQLHKTRRLAGEQGERGSLYRSSIFLEKAPKKIKPGQFFMVRSMGGTSAPLLARALSALDYNPEKGVLHVCYRIYGAGTEQLARARAGDALQVHGPYGNGFDTKEVGKRPVVLVGGGVGVPPLYLWGKHLKENGTKVTLLQGARTKKDLLLLDELRKLSIPVHVSTDDGSEGFKGRVGELFGELFSELTSPRKPIVYVCGPHPMMRDVAARCAEAGLKCRVSLEERMACATGICLACVVKVRTEDGEKNIPSCTKGPVFDAAEVVW